MSRRGHTSQSLLQFQDTENCEATRS